MASKWHLAYWLVIVWVYFVGRLRGITIEASDWFKAAIDNVPLLKGGYIFIVRDITGGDE